MYPPQAEWLFGSTLIGALLGVIVPGPAAAQSLQVTEVLAIGDMDGPMALSAVGNVILGDAGNIYVAQPQDASIAVFDSSGKRIRLIGHVGDGPGEFRRLGAMGFHAGNLWASDDLSRRVNFFSAGGDVVRTLLLSPTSVPAGISPPTTVRGILSDGSVFAYPASTATAMQPGGAVPLMRFDLNGRYLGTPFALLQEPWLMIIRHAAGAHQVIRPFPTYPRYSGAPSGGYHAAIGVIGRGAEREPVLIVASARNPNGEQVTLPPLAPPRVDEADLNELRQRWRETLVRAGVPTADANRIVRDSLRAPVRGGVAALIAGDDGIVWLRSTDQTGDPVRWIAYDTRARRFNSLVLPANISIRQSRGGLLVAVRRGEYDVEQVVVYRLRGT